MPAGPPTRLFPRSHPRGPKGDAAGVQTAGETPLRSPASPSPSRSPPHTPQRPDEVRAPRVTPSATPDRGEFPPRPGVGHIAEVLLVALLGRRARPRVRRQLRPQQADPLTPRACAIVRRHSARPTTRQAASPSPRCPGPVVPRKTGRDGRQWRRRTGLGQPPRARVTRPCDDTRRRPRQRRASLRAPGSRLWKGKRGASDSARCWITSGCREQCTE